MELRASIRGGRLILVPTDNVLAEGGPLVVYARAVLPHGVALANVTFDDDADPAEREAQIEFLANDNRRARSALKRWATATGHARIWFSDEVFEPDAADAPTGEATVTCATCDLQMTEGSEDFWGMVRSCGMFPPYCFTCGATVPQWSTGRTRAAGRRRLELVRTGTQADHPNQTGPASA